MIPLPVSKHLHQDCPILVMAGRLSLNLRDTVRSHKRGHRIRTRGTGTSSGSKEIDGHERPGTGVSFRCWGVICLKKNEIIIIQNTEYLPIFLSEHHVIDTDVVVKNPQLQIEPLVALEILLAGELPYISIYIVAM
jgi:hypothetical protein